MEIKIYKKINFRTLYLWAFPPLIIALNFLNAPKTIAETEALSAHSPLFCVFHKLTGWFCPGCGMTRSLLCFFSGQMELSFFFNPFGPVLGAFLCAFWLMSLLKTESPSLFFISQPRWTSWSLIIVIYWGVFRNFP